MARPGLILVTGAGGGAGGVGVGNKVVALLRQRGLAVRAMAHHDDDCAGALRALGAEKITGRPAESVEEFVARGEATYSLSDITADLAVRTRLRRPPLTDTESAIRSPALRGRRHAPLHPLAAVIAHIAAFRYVSVGNFRRG